MTPEQIVADADPGQAFGNLSFSIRCPLFKRIFGAGDLSRLSRHLF